MSSKSYRAPPRLDISGASFDDWLTDVTIWAKLPGDEDGKGGLLYLSLEGKAKDTVRSKLSVDEIFDKAQGVNNIINCLKTLYKKDESKNNYRTFLSFINFQRVSGQSIRDFIMEFNLKYDKVKGFTGELPGELLANSLLEGCKLSNEQKEICNATCSKYDLDTMKSQIEKVCLGNQYDSPGPSSSSSQSSLAFKMKNEPSDELYTHVNSDQPEENDVLYGYNQHQRNWKQRPSGSRPKPTTSLARPSYQRKGDFQVNPTDRYGIAPMQCEYCRCIFHFKAQCPYLPHNSVNFVEENSADIDESSQYDTQYRF